MTNIVELNAASERLIVLTMRGRTIEGIRIPWLSDDLESKKEAEKMLRNFADLIALDVLLIEESLETSARCSDKAVSLAPNHSEQVRRMVPAWLDVLAERQRQISAEGWTPEHDDSYSSCELAAAAACYAIGSPALTCSGVTVWPWDRNWWKPTSYRRDLIKSGALILAEIERLDRAAAPSAGSQQGGDV